MREKKYLKTEGGIGKFVELVLWKEIVNISYKIDVVKYYKEISLSHVPLMATITSKFIKKQYSMISKYLF